MLQFEAVCKDLGNRRILQDVSFQVREGTVLGLLGPNGAGKTTTIRLLCGIWKPTAGEIRVAGLDVKKNAQVVRRLLGVVPSNISLYGDLSALENIELVSGLYGDAPHRKERVQALLRELSLADVQHRPVSSFSKGMQQKTAIVRALVHDPRILVLDEPTSALDIASTHAVESFIQVQRQQGITALLCTHDIHQALRLCDEILVLNEGQVFWQGARDQIESADWLMDLVVRACGERTGSEHGTQSLSVSD